jgi:hypothetical protein
MVPEYFNSPHRKAYNVLYWISCVVVAILGLILVGVSGQLGRGQSLFATVGAILVGTAASFLATGVMEFAKLKTSVSELEKTLAQFIGGVLGSCPKDLEEYGPMGQWHHYSQTLDYYNAIWQYAVITFERINAATIMGFGTWITPNQQVLRYSIEVGIRGRRSILTFRSMDLRDDVPTIEVYPFPAEPYTCEFHCGLAIDRGWGGVEHIGRAILSKKPLADADTPGILPKSRHSALHELWQEHFKGAAIWPIRKLEGMETANLDPPKPIELGSDVNPAVKTEE